jgi:hypothetical protein
MNIQSQTFLTGSWLFAHYAWHRGCDPEYLRKNESESVSTRTKQVQWKQFY